MELAEHMADLLDPLGQVELARFFGGQQIRVNGTQVGILMKGVFYLRVTEKWRAELENMGSRPFSYTTGKGKVNVPRYLEAPADWIENPDVLIDFVKRNIPLL